MSLIFLSAIKSFIPSVESYTPYPVWDNKQWSWGYGTAAGYDINNKPTGTITPEQAMSELIRVGTEHYNYLSPKITRQLNANQWAALLSFSYNLGPGTANKLVPYINSGNQDALFNEWRKYVHSNNKVSTGLTIRREKEIALWNKKPSLASQLSNKNLLLIGGGLLLIGGIIFLVSGKNQLKGGLNE